MAGWELPETEPQVQYAPPWNPESFGPWLKLTMIFYKIIIWASVVLAIIYIFLFVVLVGLEGGVDNVIFIAVFLAAIIWSPTLIYIGNRLLVFMESFFPSPEDGWATNEEMKGFLSMVKRVSLAIGLFSIVLLLVSGNNYYDISGLLIGISIFGIIGAELLLRYLPYYSYRLFQMPYKDCVTLLTNKTSTFLHGFLVRDWFGGKVIRDGNTRIKIRQYYLGIRVTVLTPNGESERNRELREAVTATLEGQPLPSWVRHASWARPGRGA